jgi:hypothetical protein
MAQAQQILRAKNEEVKCKQKAKATGTAIE